MSEMVTIPNLKTGRLKITQMAGSNKRKLISADKRDQHIRQTSHLEHQKLHKSREDIEIFMIVS